MKPLDKIKCRNSHDYNLTQNKIYICLNGLEEGIFQERPFVTVVDDTGKKTVAHASRFEVITEDV